MEKKGRVMAARTVWLVGLLIVLGFGALIAGGYAEIYMKLELVDNSTSQSVTPAANIPDNYTIKTFIQIPTLNTYTFDEASGCIMWNNTDALARDCIALKAKIGNITCIQKDYYNYQEGAIRAAAACTIALAVAFAAGYFVAFALICRYCVGCCRCACQKGVYVQEIMRV